MSDTETILKFLRDQNKLRRTRYECLRFRNSAVANTGSNATSYHNDKLKAIGFFYDGNAAGVIELFANGSFVTEVKTNNSYFEGINNSNSNSIDCTTYSWKFSNIVAQPQILVALIQLWID